MISTEQRAEIARLYRAGNVTRGELAQRFNTTLATVHYVIQRAGVHKPKGEAKPKQVGHAWRRQYSRPVEEGQDELDVEITAPTPLPSDVKIMDAGGAVVRVIKRAPGRLMTLYRARLRG